MISNNFTKRHIGPGENEKKTMLKTIGVNSINELIDQTIPRAIRMQEEMNLPSGISEYEYINHIRELGLKNKLFKTYIGMGYYNTIMPAVIQRNILENPGWYTSYTPYQAEISQGRLEALLNFQTMVSELTGMPMANASLLDEGTAAAEAMIMFFRSRPRELKKRNATTFLVSSRMFPQTIDVIRTRAVPLGITLIVEEPEKFEFNDQVFGIMLQYPDDNGNISDYRTLASRAGEKNIFVGVAADIMSLLLLTPPGEWGADVVVGSTQRFGIPMGYGGPHAGYFAAREEFKRNIPGRIIGISKDVLEDRALRMALQTREQHIKRERATSNICTAQALLAIMAGMYAVYHGPEGLREIARHINILTGVLAQEIEKLGYNQTNTAFFDTINIQLPQGVSEESIRLSALEKEMNFRYYGDNNIGISIDETTDLDSINTILEIFSNANGKTFTRFVCDPEECKLIRTFPPEFDRQDSYLKHDVFNTYHSETEMMRYITKLANRDLALNRTMIPLGSCTMKLNAAAEMFALSWPEFGGIHPFVPANQAEGYLTLINNLEEALCEITGFDAISFQPNSGAAGEYAGLMVIKQFHISRGEGYRNVCLIPSSAHGTNPASAIMAGMEVIIVKCDGQGNIDLEDLRNKAEINKEKLSSLMVTYPSTHGVFEEDICEIMDIIHSNGGQVYMDGANMNAQVGLTSPGLIGADVCHLNLHKTFAIPHGGGGPGVGPIGVAAHLVPFLPSHPVVKSGGDQAISAISAAPFGSPLILPISYGYIKLLGGDGLLESTKMAILNANYIRARLDGHYKVLYSGARGRVAHEMIVDCNEFHLSANVEVIDVAKRLMDYGFHAPTVAFPVHGTLMVEPTESEPLAEIDRFCDAMIKIREEIRSIEEGKADRENNLLKNCPHTICMVSDSEWNYPYSREEAVFPMDCDKGDKYWTPVARIDDAYGDRNLFCNCMRPEED